MSRSYTPLPLSASMACSGTALPFTLLSLYALGATQRGNKATSRPTEKVVSHGGIKSGYLHVLTVFTTQKGLQYRCDGRDHVLWCSGAWYVI
jgi:hypothetical protein